MDGYALFRPLGKGSGGYKIDKSDFYLQFLPAAVTFHRPTSVFDPKDIRMSLFI
jgi:hypothetical protein